jgi:hypothetical protein
VEHGELEEEVGHLQQDVVVVKQVLVGGVHEEEVDGQ